MAGPGRLQSHFAAGENSTERWEALWKDNFTPWDRGQASPALHDTLTDRADLTGGPWHRNADGTKRRKRALVAGCGTGYEVLMLATFGYDTIGLDGAETAIKAAGAAAEGTFGRMEAQEGVGAKGTINFVMGDFYSPQWTRESGLADIDQGFDLIYDYTFFCAMNPSMRPAWAKRMSELLASDGRLICLEFPLYKDPAAPGPPFALRAETYEQHLARPGQDIVYDSHGFVIPKHGRNSDALIRLDRWLAKRTHQAGEGTDHISVWSHV